MKMSASILTKHALLVALATLTTPLLAATPPLLLTHVTVIDGTGAPA